LGDLISLEQRRAARAGFHTRARRARISFYFDLVSPWTYLAAERVDRAFGDVRWRPAMADALAGGRRVRLLPEDVVRPAAEERAGQLGMPLIWPERWPALGDGAMRVAVLAAEHGRGAPFALATSRLAFCGGFDIDDPEVIAEAAAAAGLGLDAALRAAGERHRDGALERAALRLLRGGADALPALVVGRALYAGEDRLAEAAAAATGDRAGAARRRPRLGA
jgi:2-hydroxychromene-2-carboxylate isomerase